MLLLYPIFYLAYNSRILGLFFHFKYTANFWVLPGLLGKDTHTQNDSSFLGVPFKNCTFNCITSCREMGECIQWILPLKWNKTETFDFFRAILYKTKLYRLQKCQERLCQRIEIFWTEKTDKLAVKNMWNGFLLSRLQLPIIFRASKTTFVSHA